MTFDPALFLQALGSIGLLQGAVTALLLSVLVQAAGFLISLPLAVALDEQQRFLRVGSKVYVWLFRAAPLLLVLLIVWNGLPQLVPALLKASWFSPFIAAFLAMTLVTAAYMAETMRGALRSVGKGQKEAAYALGFRRPLTFMLIVLPQALRIAMPTLVNEFINLVKLTSLAYVISLREIMAVTNDAIAQSFRFVEWYAAALIYYLVIVSLLMVAQIAVEKRLK